MTVVERMLLSMVPCPLWSRAGVGIKQAPKVPVRMVTVVSVCWGPGRAELHMTCFVGIFTVDLRD